MAMTVDTDTASHRQATPKLQQKIAVPVPLASIRPIGRRFDATKTPFALHPLAQLGDHRPRREGQWTRGAGARCGGLQRRLPAKLELNHVFATEATRNASRSAAVVLCDLLWVCVTCFNGNSHA